LTVTEAVVLMVFYNLSIIKHKIKQNKPENKLNIPPIFDPLSKNNAIFSERLNQYFLMILIFIVKRYTEEIKRKILKQRNTIFS